MSDRMNSKIPRLVTKKRPANSSDPQQSSKSSRVSLKAKQEQNPCYEASGLKNTLHGNIYQLKLLMLFLKRGLDKGYSFRLATEMDDAEKFDDLVFEYENERKDGTIWRFLQAKHKQDESKKISVNDLLTEKDGEFSLQKYFISYRKIKKNPEFSGKNNELKDFIICTNIHLEERLQSSFERISEKDNILDIDTESDSKKPERRKLKMDDDFSKKEELVSILKNTSDLNRLARKLAECVTKEEPINLKDPLFRSYHSALRENKVIDIENKELHSNFVNDNSLSELAKKFRQIFQKEASKIIKKLPRRTIVDTWNEVKGKKLNLPSSFGKVFQLDIKPCITDTEQFAEVIANLISQQQDKVVAIKRE
jgi:hypothetical protein